MGLAARGALDGAAVVGAFLWFLEMLALIDRVGEGEERSSADSTKSQPSSRLAEREDFFEEEEIAFFIAGGVARGESICTNESAGSRGWGMGEGECGGSAVGAVEGEGESAEEEAIVAPSGALEFNQTVDIRRVVALKELYKRETRRKEAREGPGGAGREAGTKVSPGGLVVPIYESQVGDNDATLHKESNRGECGASPSARGGKAGTAGRNANGPLVSLISGFCFNETII